MHNIIALVLFLIEKNLYWNMIENKNEKSSSIEFLGRCMNLLKLIKDMHCKIQNNSYSLIPLTRVRFRIEGIKGS